MATREELQHRIAIIEAHMDGKLIDRKKKKSSMPWVTDNGLTNFDFKRYEYRAKTKPKEAWVVGDRVFYNEDAASDYELHTSGKFVRKYREVLGGEANG